MEFQVVLLYGASTKDLLVYSINPLNTSALSSSSALEVDQCDNAKILQLHFLDRDSGLFVPQTGFADQVDATQLEGIQISGYPFLFCTIGDIFSILNKDVATAVFAGVQTAFRRINAEGGIDGKILSLLLLGDSYSAAKTTTWAARALVEYPQLSGFVGSFGTAPSEALASYLSTEGLDIPLIEPITGNVNLYRPPLNRVIRTARTCYQHEAAAWSAHYARTRSNSSRFAVLRWDNAFGQQFEEMLSVHLAAEGLSINTMVKFPPGTTNIYPYITSLIRAEPNYVGIIATGTDCALPQDSFKKNITYYISSVVGQVLPDMLHKLDVRASFVFSSHVIPPEGEMPVSFTSALMADFAEFAPYVISIESSLREGYIAGRIIASSLLYAADNGKLSGSLLRDLIDDCGVFNISGFSIGPFSTNLSGLRDVWMTGVDIPNSKYASTAVAIVHGNGSCPLISVTEESQPASKTLLISLAVVLPICLIALVVTSVALFWLWRSREKCPEQGIPRQQLSAFIQKNRLALSRVVACIVAIVGILIVVLLFFGISLSTTKKGVTSTIPLLFNQTTFRVRDFMDMSLNKPQMATVQIAQSVESFNISLGKNTWTDWALFLSNQISVLGNSTQMIYFGLNSGELVGATKGGMISSCVYGVCYWPIQEDIVIGYPAPSAILLNDSSYDCRWKSWWLLASLSGIPTWSGGDSVSLTVSFATPVVDESTSSTYAVFGVEISLGIMQNLLSELPLTERTIVLITEEDGSMLISNKAESSGDTVKANILLSSDSTIACVAENFNLQLQQNPSKAFVTNSTEPIIATFTCHGETILASLYNWVDSFNYVFVIIIATPEKDFTEEYTHSLKVLLGTALTVLFAVALLTVGALLLFTRVYGRIAVQDSNVNDQANVDSGLQQVIKQLRSVKEGIKDHNLSSTLDAVIEKLTETKSLYLPDLHNISNDKETNAWINEEFITKEAHPVQRGISPWNRNSPRTVERSDSLLRRTDQWNFNVFELGAKTDHTLVDCFFSILKARNILQAVHLEPQSLENLLVQLEALYIKTPYHNVFHATDVLQCMHYFLSSSLVEKLNLTPLEQLAIFIAAAAHDVGHDGRNNAFHVATCSERALRFNFVSVQENYHANTTLKLAFDLFLFKKLTAEEAHSLRTIIVDLILATDMTQHFSFLGKFSTRLESNNFAPQDSDKLLILQMLLKAADISNASRPFEIMAKWSTKVIEEFFLQGDEERSLSLPISPFMDRENSNPIKSQQGFISFIVKPLYEAIAKFAPEVVALPLKHLEDNLKFWKETTTWPSV
ncbi:3'5'-cyclic nucleotide phosphodiesterase [Pelomyxa schiedti]|nr:3'5'-cyclic nucleotide phosphodiesterase [Pelomyxa schiedti]